MSKSQKSEFSLVGQLIGFIYKDGYKLKYLRMALGEREYWLKVSKELRSNLDAEVQSGCWLAVRGTQKLSLKTGKLKLKAETISLVSAETNPEAKFERISKRCSPSTHGKSKVLICQKSSCWKRGGKKVCQALQTSLRSHGLEDKVDIKLTGCLKQCKKGPNLVTLPDKTRYTHVNSDRADQIVRRHFASSEKELSSLSSKK